LRKMVLLSWGVGVVGAGSVPGGAAGGARFGVLRLGEGRVTSRDYVGRGKVPVAGKRGVEVGRRLVGRRRAGRATLIWSTSMSPDQKRAFLNYQIEYYRVIIEALRARSGPHTNGPRNVPRCGALSLL
jgi:hypothetical protein